MYTHTYAHMYAYTCAHIHNSSYYFCIYDPKNRRQKVEQMLACKSQKLNSQHTNHGMDLPYGETHTTEDQSAFIREKVLILAGQWMTLCGIRQYEFS